MAKLAAESVLWDLATEGFQGDRVRLRAATTARVEASISLISSTDNSKSKTSMFSAMRSGLVDLG